MRRKKLIVLFSILCLLASIIVLSSVVFSVQHIYEDCKNGDSSVIIDGDMTLGEMVLTSHNLKKGESIFLADKESAAHSIEKNIPSIRVLSIKKQFPNRIYIYYEILFDYLQIHDGGKFYTLSDECKVTNVFDESRDKDKIVHVYLGGDIDTPKLGEKLYSDKLGEINILSELLSAIIALDQEYYEITQMFEFIDLRSTHNYIYMKTSTGVIFRLMGWNDVPLKVQVALSLYGRELKYRTDGTITVSDSLNSTYSSDVYYENG